MAKTITATKDGKQRTFAKATWDLLGEDHAGWQATEKAAPAETKTDTKPKAK